MLDPLGIYRRSLASQFGLESFLVHSPALLGALAFMSYLALLHGFLAKCYLVLAFVPLVSSSTIPTKRTVPIQVSGNGTTYTGTQVDSQDVFLGIPYAQPPVGNLRFRRPLPIATAPTVNAQNYGPRCLQSTASNDTSEDCLTLNIWRPHGVTRPMPVILWICEY
ncbi:hypothetical protein FRC08_016318 [Ceratobasidium sp. 394]|nr:hypothetical protein FRC08_016318 [Ceratobasidium sp. 394]